MNRRIGSKPLRELTLAGLMAILAIAMGAGVAFAGHGGWGRGHAYGHFRGYGGPAVYRSYAYAPRYVVRPAYRHRYVAYGPRFSLGFAIGAPAPYDDCWYDDPYCDLRFASLDAYYDHCYGHRHPWRARVVSYEPGYPAYSIAYVGGGWSYCR